MLSRRPLSYCVCLLMLLVSDRLPGEIRFPPQSIDDHIEIGYGLAIGDVNGNGRNDILLADKTEFVWYENPGTRTTPWPRHVMIQGLTEHDNVCLAARDLDGDGQVEVAVGATGIPARQVTRRRVVACTTCFAPPILGLFGAVPIRPFDATTHRMHWVRWQDDDNRLVVLPLHGQGNKNGEGDAVRVTAYRVPLDAPEQSTGEVIHEAMHMTHNFDVDADSDQTTEILWIGGREGIDLVSAQGTHNLIANPISVGVGEIRRAQVTDSGLNLIAIEPMHGTQVVFYDRTASGDWRRQILDDQFNQGHALAAGDLLGLGHDQVVAGWRTPNAENRVGVRMYVPNAQGTTWQTFSIDDNQMACEDLKLADLDGDGRQDIIAAGRATNNVIVYWNDATPNR